MDVTRENLEEALEKLTRALAHPNCEFVAIDEEMTGISQRNAQFRECNPLGDSPASRYARMRSVASTFGLVQLGIAAFVRSDDGAALRAHVFNCYVFPGDEPGGRDIALSAGAISFLRDHGMDWATWLDEGVPYVDAAAQERLEAAAREPPSRDGSLVHVRNDELRAKCEEQLARVPPFAEAHAAPAARAELVFDAQPSALARRFLYQEVERRFPDLVTEKRPQNQIAVVALPAADRAAKLEAEAQTRLAGARRKVGSRRLYAAVRDACRDRRLPLVGHNCLFDLLFLLEHFEEPLPENYARFKRLLATQFPVVVDTKAVAGAVDLGGCKTDLGNLYERVAPTESGRAVEFARGFGKYGGPMEVDRRAADSEEEGEVMDEAPVSRLASEATVDDARAAAFRAQLDAPPAPPRPQGQQRFHEAGWDAFTTGVVYERLRERLAADDKAVPANRLHLMRTPHEIDLTPVAADTDVQESEFAEPLAPAPRGAAWHVRLDRAAGARAPGYDDVRQLVVAAGATACHRAAAVSDDATEWYADCDLPEDAALADLTAPSPLVAAAYGVPWACFEEQRARLDAAAAGGAAPAAPASTKRGRGKKHARAAKRLWTWLVAKVQGAPAATRKRAGRAASAAEGAGASPPRKKVAR